MQVLVCGAGEVGAYAARVLAEAGNEVVVIDRDASRLEVIEQTMDVGTLAGNAMDAEVLVEAGAAHAGLLVAATNLDEVNLLAASAAKGVGTKRTIARVHHRVYFERRGLDYARHLGIDHLVCPEYATASVIAEVLRNPAALAVERFARGEIEVQQLPVSEGAPATRAPLRELALPEAVRVAAVERDGIVALPEAETRFRPGDVVTVAGEVAAFEKARRLFRTEADREHRTLVMGGSTQGVWLCRALVSREAIVRLYEPRADRAQELADKLRDVTVVQLNPMDPDSELEEPIRPDDAFVAVTEEDEQNILAAALAKKRGARVSIAVVQRSTYLHMIETVGVDHAFSPRVTAVNEIQQLIVEGPFRRLTSMPGGAVEVYEIRVPAEAEAVVDRSLAAIGFPARTLVVAIQRGKKVRVPGAEDRIEAGDICLLIGRADSEKKLRKLFGVS